MLAKPTIETFKAFGDRKYVQKDNISEFFKSIVFEDTDVTRQYFIECCMKILNGNYKDVNSVLLNKYVNIYSAKGIDYITTLLIDVFSEYLTTLSMKIQEMLENNTLTVNEFVNMYNNYNTTTSVLRRALIGFDQSIELEKSKTNYSYIQIIKSIMFYTNVLNRKFLCKTTNIESCLYDIIITMLITKPNTQDIVSIYKIFVFYKNLGIIANKSGKSPIDTEIINKITISDGKLSKYMINTLVSDINSSIINLHNMTDKTEVQKMITNIRDQINIGSSFVQDKSLFLVMYRMALTDRLLNTTVNCEIEKEFAMSLSFNSDPDIYAKIMMQIKDIHATKKHNQCFQKMTLTTTSEKYRNYDVSKFRRDICNYIVFKSYAWDIEPEDQYTMPINLCIYLDVFNAYYKGQYKDRVLTCLNDKSTVLLKMTFGAKEYNIHMTLSQYLVLNLINEKGEISPMEIAKTLGMRLKRLSVILNSIISFKLITRSEGPRTDPNIPFRINNEFTYHTDKFSIVGLYNNILNNSLKGESVQSSGPSSAALKAIIIGFLVNGNTATKPEILEQVCKRFNITIGESIIDPILNELIASGKLVQTGDAYTYVKKTIETTT